MPVPCGEDPVVHTVDPARNLFHCFGCGEGGDVYGFLQRAEALTFPEAVERLARIVGYELRYREQSPGQRRALGRRTRLTAALAEAARFYAARLDDEGAAPAREYLSGRGLGPAEARRFRLGWAPDRWDGLVRHLAGAGFDTSEAQEAGLVSSGPHGLRDRFRGRIVFPILEASGADVVAFGGRVVPGVQLATGPRDGEPPKYINSSESPVYKKSATLYARTGPAARSPGGRPPSSSRATWTSSGCTWPASRTSSRPAAPR